MAHTYPKLTSKDYIFYDLVKSMGHPPIVITDFRPFVYEIALITSHDVCEQITKSSKTFPYSVPKSPTMGDLLPLIGERSLLIAEDEIWKALRRTYNQGFAPTHLATLLPRIVEKTKLFVIRLDELAKSGKSSPMDGVCIDLTFDIIGAVVMDVDLNAQLDVSKQSALVRYYRELIHSYTDQTGLVGLPNNPFLTRRRKKLTRAIDEELKAIISSKHAEVIAKTGGQEPLINGNSQVPKNSRPRSVLALSLQAESSTSPLSPLALQTTADTLKTFLFAGHDTTSILLQWAFYELSRTPRALASLRAELDAVFGASATSADIADALASPGGDDAIKKLAYTSAVIKETLRLYPPAGSARRVPDGAGFMVNVPSGDGSGGTKSVCLDGFVLYNCHFIVQRDPAVFGPDADEWVPERWLGDVDTSRVDEIPEKSSSTNGGASSTTKKVPPSAWRPFERGPRNCIGQELANLEARVILAVAARRYDFIKVGAGEVLKDKEGNPVLDDVKGRYEVVSPMFNTRQVTSKPFDGMTMVVKFHEQQA
ncbi:Cytochrome P450 [Lasiodiplodia theobromae]|uniref:Cytochrome P450 n=1 Tax=Lasiodiplodia theobromae TaxID=45133 RepID=UPI0015C3E8D0|nr:Cytochrome P450 [Lasiodiplodia theobromae]KAF4540021.1 Cytochrome P450 [Lasiodiplodia theobromae]